LSTVASYAALEGSFRLGISTGQYIIKEGWKAIWKTMAPLHMPVPKAEMLFATSNEFYLKWNFPNCVGSTDGKHRRLRCPSNSGSMYYNYKHYYSIALQGLAVPGIDSLPLMLVLMESNQTVGFFVTVRCTSF